METLPTVKNLLLFGNCGAGKTSIQSVIFGHPNQIDVTPKKFMGTFPIKIWDCGSRSSMYVKMEDVFKDIAVLVYIFDVETLNNKETIHSYQKFLECTERYSKSVPIFILVHKMDKITDRDTKIVFQQLKVKILEITQQKNIEILGIYSTSIWDDSLYKAWCQIIQQLTTNIEIINETLAWLCQGCDYDEVVLFDKESLLLIAKHKRNTNQHEEDTYERLSFPIKLFQTSCRQKKTQLKSINFICGEFSFFLGEFIPNTYLMVIDRTSKIQPSVFELSLDKAKHYFSKKLNNEVIDDAIQAAIIDIQKQKMKNFDEKQ